MKTLRIQSILDIPTDNLTEEERDAWLHPLTYHSFHMERLGADTYLLRDSQTTEYHIGTLAEITTLLPRLQCRKVDVAAAARNREIRTNLTILSQEEIDDLLSDL